MASTACTPPGRGPAGAQPQGDVGGLGEPGEQRLALAPDPSQHTVDERAEVAGLVVLQREAHAEVDRRVVGRIEEEELRGAHMEDRLELSPDGALGQALGEAALEDAGDLAATA